MSTAILRKTDIIFLCNVSDIRLTEKKKTFQIKVVGAKGLYSFLVTTFL